MKSSTPLKSPTDYTHQPGPRVLVGLSGGIDSAMAVIRLKQEGYHVTGITLKTWNKSESSQNEMIHKALVAAQQLNIPHHVVDVEKPFKKEVVDYFCEEYLMGRTPNPCHRCNPRIKWHYLLLKADELNCPYIATGHYVRKVKEKGLWYLLKGKDPIKDQSYFLWNLSQTALSRTLFPLGSLTKNKVKQTAADLNLNLETGRRESMGICFLNRGDYRTFLRDKHNRSEINIIPGDIVDEEGTLLGHHQGIAGFTIGQKRNLQLSDKGWFVKDIDPTNHRLIVSKTASLMVSTIQLTQYQMVKPLKSSEKIQADVRIRGLDRVPPLPGILSKKGEQLQVELSEPAWALTPGQAMVFYEGDKVIGGGIA